MVPPEKAGAYIVAACKRMAAAGFDLPVPPEAGPDRAGAAYADVLRKSPAVQVSCTAWSVMLDEQSGQVLDYMNSAHFAARCKQIEETWGRLGLAASPTPKMTAARAREIVAKTNSFKAFGADPVALGLGEPDVKFGGMLPGWNFTYQRSYKGFPFVGESLMLIIDDATGELCLYEDMTSDAAPPEPVVRLSEADARRAVETCFKNSNLPMIARMRKHGFVLDPGTLRLEGPRYVHPFFMPKGPQSGVGSTEIEVVLAYVCRIKPNLLGKTGDIGIWIDAGSGQVVGAFY
jgi:hypothetical protein